MYTEQPLLQVSSVALPEKTDTTSLAYASYGFVHAMNAGLYRPRQPTDAAKAIYARLRQLPEANLLSQSAYAPVTGFHQHEPYTNHAGPDRKPEGVDRAGV